jgi:hypothetical protein
MLLASQHLRYTMEEDHARRETQQVWHELDVHASVWHETFLNSSRPP